MHSGNLWISSSMMDNQQGCLMYSRRSLPWRGNCVACIIKLQREEEIQSSMHRKFYGQERSLLATSGRKGCCLRNSSSAYYLRRWIFVYGRESLNGYILVWSLCQQRFSSQNRRDFNSSSSLRFDFTFSTRTLQEAAPGILSRDVFWMADLQPSPRVFGLKVHSFIALYSCSFLTNQTDGTGFFCLVWGLSAMSLLFSLILGLKWQCSSLGWQLHLCECGYPTNVLEIRLISGWNVHSLYISSSIFQIQDLLYTMGQACSRSILALSVSPSLSASTSRLESLFICGTKVNRSFSYMDLIFCCNLAASLSCLYRKSPQRMEVLVQYPTDGWKVHCFAIFTYFSSANFYRLLLRSFRWSNNRSSTFFLKLYFCSTIYLDFSLT